MARFKVISRKEHKQQSASMPKNSRAFVKAGFYAMEFVVEDTQTGQRIEIEPIPFTKGDPKFKRNVEKLALDAAAKVVKAQR